MQPPPGDTVDSQEDNGGPQSDIQRAADGEQGADQLAPQQQANLGEGGGAPNVVTDPNAGGTPRLPTPPRRPQGGLPLVVSPTAAVIRTKTLNVRTARATGVWVTTPGGCAQLVEHVNELPNMPGWIRPSATAGLDADLIAACNQFEVPRLFQNWLVHYGITSRKLVGGTSPVYELDTRV